MNKEFVALFSFLFVLTLLFCGCSALEDAYNDGAELAKQQMEDSQKKEEMNTKVRALDPLEYIGSIGIGSHYFYYYRDVSSDVMYIYVDDYQAGGFCVMLAPDGYPLLYSEWMESLESRK